MFSTIFNNLESSAVHHNESAPFLVEKALMRKEGDLTDTGALAVRTGKYTGRSPEDKYIVDTKGVHNKIHWGSVNRPVSRKVFREIRDEMVDYLREKEVFVFDGFAGADPRYRRKFRIINEKAWQNLFIHNLLTDLMRKN